MEYGGFPLSVGRNIKKDRYKISQTVAAYLELLKSIFSINIL